MEANNLCLHTLRADCNNCESCNQPCLTTFASTRSVQIATKIKPPGCVSAETLPPHAPCRLQLVGTMLSGTTSVFASTRSVQIATKEGKKMTAQENFASTRSVQIATGRRAVAPGKVIVALPPHAPCRLQPAEGTNEAAQRPLPPHAPCRLQRLVKFAPGFVFRFASTRSVQIATGQQMPNVAKSASLPPHAPCRLQPFLAPQ